MIHIQLLNRYLTKERYHIINYLHRSVREKYLLVQKLQAEVSRLDLQSQIKFVIKCEFVS